MSAVDDACLHGHFPIDDQAELAREVVAALPLEEGAWRLDPTVHPFATAISPSDIRITTRYDESYIGASLWAVIHEAGHGLYENGVARELERSPLVQPVSLGFHESQSRMWENWVGRGRPYLSESTRAFASGSPSSSATWTPRRSTGRRTRSSPR